MPWVRPRSRLHEHELQREAEMEADLEMYRGLTNCGTCRGDGMTRREHCKACGTPAPDERVIGESRGGHVGHQDSEKRLWFCQKHYKDAAVRDVIVEEAFGELIEARREMFPGPRTKKEAKEMEKRDNQRAGYGTPAAAGVPR